MLLVFLTLLLLAPLIEYGGLGISAQSIIALWFVVWVVFVDRSKNIFKSNWLWVALIFALLGIVSGLVNYPLGSTEFWQVVFKSVYRAVFLASLMVATASYIKKGGLKKIVICTSLLGVFQAIVGTTAFIFSWSGPYGLGIIPSRYYSSLYSLVPGRVVGTFVSADEAFIGANLLASFLSICIFMSLALVLKSSSRKERMWWLAVIILQVLAMVLTYTRSSLVILAMAVIPVTLLIPKRKIFFWFYVLFAALIMFVPGVYERFVVDPFSDRISLARQGVLLVEDNLWWGVGPGNFVSSLTKNPLRYETSLPTNPHNGYLLAVAEYGLIPSILFLGFLIALSIKFTKFLPRGNPGRYYQVCLSAAWLSFLAQNLFNNFFFIFKISAFFWILYPMVSELLAKSINGKK